MAIREEHDFLSENERTFLYNAIHTRPHVRADGRELMQQRKIRVQFRRNDTQAQAEVQLGRTRVIANVHGDIVPPFPDRPTEGFLHFSVELSPMASQNFDASANSSRQSPLAVELARIVDRGIRECRAIDTEALAIVAGEKVWAISCALHVVDHGGNLVDCVSLAAIAALLHFRRPDIQLNSTSGFTVDDHASVPLSLHHLPIAISFAFVEPLDTSSKEAQMLLLIDPTDREERIADGSITFTFNSFRELCAVHKIGGSAIAPTDVLRCANVAAARVSELTTYIQQEADAADALAVAHRRARLRGTEFVDKSSIDASKVSTIAISTSTTTQPVDLVDLTDFRTLHAPISLRDDPTAAETNAQVTSMAHLLASLEESVAADETTGTMEQTTTNDALQQTNDNDNDDDARAAFAALTATLSVRSLVASASSTATRTPMKHKAVATVDSDSEEEHVVVQSEFEPRDALVQPAVASKRTPPAATRRTNKTRTKQLSASSDDESDADDLSAAIKRK